MLWLSIFLLTIAGYLLQYYWDSIRAVFMLWHVSGPPTYPIVGSGHLLINKTQAEIVQIALYWTMRLGDFFKLWLGPEVKVIVQDPNDVEILLNNVRYIDKASDYEFFRPWMNDGMLLSTGKKYHDRRKIITPAFNFQMMEKYAERFDRLGKKFIKKLKEFDADAEIETFHLIGLYALDVICETVMGVSMNAMSQPDSDYIQAIIDITHVVHIRIANFALRNPLIFKYSKLRQTEEKAIRVINNFTDEVIRKRREELIETVNKINNNEDAASATAAATSTVEEIGIHRKKRTLLDILLQATIDGKPLTDLDIREEIDVFLFGGHDTVTAALTFYLYLISKNPEAQQKCYEEIVSVFGDDTEQTATLSLLNKLSYLELTIKEALRLFSPIPIIARTAIEDIKLTKGRVIPRGSTIIIPFFTMSRYSKFFEDSQQFKPERFLDEQVPFTYLPFSFGPRTCPGQKFAMFEMKSILSKILRNFEVSLTKDSEMEPVLGGATVLRPENSIKIKLKCRC